LRKPHSRKTFSIQWISESCCQNNGADAAVRLANWCPSALDRTALILQLFSKGSGEDISLIETDIVIVGGGPAGMAAALECASHGFSVVLVAPADASGGGDDRTTALMLPAVRMLSGFGAWQAIELQAAPLKTMRIVDGSQRLVRAPTVTFEASEISESAFGYNITNRALNGALAEALNGTPAITRIDAMASSATFNTEQAVIALTNGETVGAKLAVGADGVHSVVREASGIGARSWAYPQTAVVLAFDHSREHGFASNEFHTETGPFTQVPMMGKRSSLVWVLDPGEAQRIARLDAEELAKMIEHRMGSMLGRVENVSKPQCWPLSGMVAHQFAGERLALAGQAAHVFPPIGAQGLNLGLRDVADLGICIASAGGDPGASAVTRRYDRIRRADITSRTGAVDLLNRSLLTDLLPVQFARAAGLGVLAAVPPLRGLMMREGMEPGSGFRALFSRGLREKDQAGADRSS
jgi:2-octaprenyl-6-methoxyphenol hydroxylase